MIGNITIVIFQKNDLRDITNVKMLRH